MSLCDVMCFPMIVTIVLTVEFTSYLNTLRFLLSVTPGMLLLSSLSINSVLACVFQFLFMQQHEFVTGSQEQPGAFADWVKRTQQARDT